MKSILALTWLMFIWIIIVLYQNKPIKRVDQYGNCIDFSTKHDCDDPPQDYHTVTIWSTE